MTPDEMNEACRTLVVDLRDGTGEGLNDRIAQVDTGIRDATAALDYVGDLAAAMTLVPLGTWYHWSHLGFSITPTRPAGGVPMTVAVDHWPERVLGGGGPLSFSVHATDSREARAALPRMVCQAVVLARRAPVIKALARRDRRHRLLQTGGGPLVVTPEGTLVDLPFDGRLTRDGRIVPHDEADGVGRIEDPDA